MNCIYFQSMIVKLAKYSSPLKKGKRYKKQRFIPKTFQREKQFSDKRIDHCFLDDGSAIWTKVRSKEC